MQESFDPDSAAAWQVRLFKKSPPKQRKLRNLQRFMSPLEGRTCLDVGGEDGVLPWMLRRNGGTWVSADDRPAALASMSALLGEDQVFSLEGPELPFEDQSFDTIVLIDYLERVREDGFFLRECHRCLKPNGELIAHVRHVKSFSVVRGLRKLLNQTDEREGRVRPGYRLRDLYEISKDGYDIVESATDSGFFEEFLDTLCRIGGGAEAMPRSGEDGRALPLDQRDLRRFATVHRRYSWMGPLFVLATGLDAIFSFTRNHTLVIKARPRTWNRRQSVKLRDGRSIAEAAIRTKIGSAADLVKPLPGS